MNHPLACRGASGIQHPEVSRNSRPYKPVGVGFSLAGKNISKRFRNVASRRARMSY
jgi:hypothetical protein